MMLSGGPKGDGGGPAPTKAQLWMLGIGMILFLIWAWWMILK